MTSQVSLREAAENRSRAAAEANISVYKELAPLLNKLKDTWTEIKTTVMESISTNVIQPMVDFISSKEGKEFLKKLPGYVDSALTKTKELITSIGSFLSDTDSKYPWLKKLLAGLGGGAILLKVTGLDKTLVKGAKTLFSGLMGDKSAVKSDLGLELGTVSNPMQVEMVDSMNVGDLIGSKGKAGFMKQITTLFKNPKVMFRALRMKGSIFGKALGKMAGGLSKLGPMFKSFGKGLKTAAGKLGSWLKKGLGKILPKAGGALQSLWKGAKSLGSKALSGVKSVGSKALGGIKSAGSAVSSVASSAWKGVKSGASKVGGAISKMNPIKALKKGLMSKAGKFIGKAAKGGLIGALINAGQLAYILKLVL